MKTWKFISGMILVAGLAVACSSEEMVPGIDGTTDGTTEKVGEITLGIELNTAAGTTGSATTRGASDVDAAGAPKGAYPFNYVYLVKANSSIPAVKFEDHRKMDITGGTRLNIWFTDQTRTKVAIQPAGDPTMNVLEFRTSKVGTDGKVDESDIDNIGDTFFYSSQVPGVDNKTVILPQERDGTSIEFGDKLFISEQFVFGVDNNGQLIIYQVYPSKEQIYPKDGNSLWPISMGRFTASVNARFMFVDTDENSHYGHKAEEVRTRWNELFPNVSLDKIYTDGGLLTDFPITFDLCKRSVVYTSHDGSIRLYGDEEKSTSIEKLSYSRFTGEAPIATEGWGFRSKAYPFIFPVVSLDKLSGVQINVCIPDLNVRMKCSIPFPANNSYAFTANTTTFLWMMMDIDEFKSLCEKAGVLNQSPSTRSAGMREIEVTLPSSSLYIE